MIDSQRFQTLAHLKGKCQGFELEPGVYTGCLSPAPPADCPVCEGSGEVFILIDAVRNDCSCSIYMAVECSECDPKIKHNGRPCCGCGGLDTVASQDVGDWWEALDDLGFEAKPQRRYGRWDITLYSKGNTVPWGDGGEGDTLLEALVGTVERVVTKDLQTPVQGERK